MKHLKRIMAIVVSLAMLVGSIPLFSMSIFAEASDDSSKDNEAPFPPYFYDVAYGDVNSDGYINAKDVVSLRRYLAGGWDVTIDEEAANVNGDDYLNAKDVVTLRRYLAGGWDVELG